MEVDGRPWTVRVLGRSEGGRHVGPAPLMLLGFWQGGVAEAHGDPDRELLTVGRGLAELSPVELREALDRARARVAPGGPRPFFVDPGEKRRP
jgi:hypothetical protein